MFKRLLITVPKKQLLEPNRKPKPERYELAPVRQGKKMFKKEIYSTLLEIILALPDQNNGKGD